LYAALANNGLAAIPNASLIENIGFDGEATHTKKRKKHLSTPSNSLDGELKHPDTLDVNPQTERQLMDILFPGFFKKKWREFINLLSNTICLSGFLSVVFNCVCSIAYLYH
jgi:hypothetical protein